VLDLFAVFQPGLEDLGAAELAALGLGPLRTLPGGVAFSGGLADLARANLRLSLATRLLVRVGSFRAPGFPELHAHAARLPWERFIAGGAAPRVVVSATAHKSRLYHTGGIAERVVKGLGERLGVAPELLPAEDDDAAAADGAAPTRIFVRLERDHCTVSLDSSGEPLHRRGYRLALARAPLRPTLAAAMLHGAGWRPGEPLLDPFCGSGTLLIEAARLACGHAPGDLRGFAFTAWPGFDGAAALARARADLPAHTPSPGPIVGSDRDPGAIAAARANAQRAGVLPALRLEQRPLSAVDPPPGPGLVLSNPPYGVRVGKRGPLRDLYAQLGHVLRDRLPGWRVALLCGDDLWRCCDLPLAPTRGLRNGGLAVQLVQGRVPA